jgi:hypothetical protein
MDQKYVNALNADGSECRCPTDRHFETVLKYRLFEKSLPNGKKNRCVANQIDDAAGDGFRAVHIRSVCPDYLSHLTLSTLHTTFTVVWFTLPKERGWVNAFWPDFH